MAHSRNQATALRTARLASRGALACVSAALVHCAKDAAMYCFLPLVGLLGLLAKMMETTSLSLPQLGALWKLGIGWGRP